MYRQKIMPLIGFFGLASLASPMQSNTMYESSSSAKRACQRWASEGQSIFISHDSHVASSGYPTDSLYPPGSEHAGMPVYLYLQVVSLRRCDFDYQSTAYIGYQHKGVNPVPTWWPKRKDGTDWSYDGKILPIFRSWDFKSGGVPVRSFAF